MCELFGMSARSPDDVNHSLKLLIPRGGEIGPHADGWGVAFYEGPAARIFKEPRPAAESRCLQFISDYDYQSKLVIGHIRRANPPEYGRISANTHPFEREWQGRSWVFAHNGKLPGIRKLPSSPQYYHPLGETDSEYAFCLMLNTLRDLYPGAPPSGEELLRALHPVVADLVELNEFNFLLSNGSSLLAFAHTKLYQLCRHCRYPDGTTQRIILLATAPLDDDPWKQIPIGTLRLYSHGEQVVSTQLDEGHATVTD